MYSPASGVVPRMVSTFGPWGARHQNYTSAASSSSYETANACCYFPLPVPVTCVVRRLWWANGSTVSASYNIDIGLYSDGGYKPGTKLVSSGSTAQGTASQVQFVDVTDTTIGPGLYWIALACSSNVATFFRVSVSTADAMFRFQQTSTFPLPSTATPVESSGSAPNFYVCGFATTASP